MKRIEIRYAGVDLTGYPPHLDKLIREGRYNFFEVPWNCSCPGYGNVIVTSEQLSRIRAFPQIEENGADLELLVFDNEGRITTESAVLHFILPVRAVPIWGEHFRHSEIDEDGFPSLGSVYDTEANSEGLWSLELQDRRTKLISDYWIPLNAGAFNVQDAPFDGTKFLSRTAQSETVAWKTKEIIDRITDASVVFTFEDGNFDTLPKVYDVFVSGIPSLIAVDLLLNATITPHVFRFDPTQPLGRVFNLVSLTKSIEPLVSAYAPLRLFGGGEIIFRQYRFPGGMPVWRNRAGAAADFSDYYASAAAPGGTSPYVRHTKSTSTGGITYRDRQPYHAVYSGFCSGFLSHNYPVSLVIFNWANHVPTTEVYVGRQSPVRTLLNGPTGHFLRDIPLPVSINGDIGLPLPNQGMSVSWFRVKSVADDHLVCRTLTGGITEGTSDVYVAKPYELRRGTYDTRSITFNGQLLVFSYSNGYTRSVQYPGGTATQIIIPAYTGSGAGYPGETILGGRTFTGMTINNKPVEWLDLNIGARQWAELQT